MARGFTFILAIREWLPHAGRRDSLEKSRSHLSARSWQWRVSHSLLGKTHLQGRCDGGDRQFVVALDCLTGKVLWKTSRDTASLQKFSFHTPLVIEVGGTKQLVSAGSGVINGYDLETGSENLARAPWRLFGSSPGPCLVRSGIRQHWLTTPPKCWRFGPDGKGDVTDTHIAWKTRRAAPNTSISLARGQRALSRLRCRHRKLSGRSDGQGSLARTCWRQLFRIAPHTELEGLLVSRRWAKLRY